VIGTSSLTRLATESGIFDDKGGLRCSGRNVVSDILRLWLESATSEPQKTPARLKCHTYPTSGPYCNAEDSIQAVATIGRAVCTARSYASDRDSYARELQCASQPPSKGFRLARISSRYMASQCKATMRAFQRQTMAIHQRKATSLTARLDLLLVGRYAQQAQ